MFPEGDIMRWMNHDLLYVAHTYLVVIFFIILYFKHANVIKIWIPIFLWQYYTVWYVGIRNHFSQSLIPTTHSKRKEMTIQWWASFFPFFVKMASFGTYILLPFTRYYFLAIDCQKSDSWGCQKVLMKWRLKCQKSFWKKFFRSLPFVHDCERVMRCLGSWNFTS